VHRCKSQTPKIVKYSHNPHPKTPTFLLELRPFFIASATAGLGPGELVASRTQPNVSTIVMTIVETAHRAQSTASPGVAKMVWVYLPTLVIVYVRGFKACVSTAVNLFSHAAHFEMCCGVGVLRFWMLFGMSLKDVWCLCVLCLGMA
jgi:hypothetical protein